MRSTDSSLRVLITSSASPWNARPYLVEYIGVGIRRFQTCVTESGLPQNLRFEPKPRERAGPEIAPRFGDIYLSRDLQERSIVAYDTDVSFDQIGGESITNDHHLSGLSSNSKSRELGSDMVCELLEGFLASPKSRCLPRRGLPKLVLEYIADSPQHLL